MKRFTSVMLWAVCLRCLPQQTPIQAPHPRIDGVTQHAEPILVADPLVSERRVYNPTVIVKDGKLAMLYRADVEGAQGSEIRLAMSADGRVFQRSKANPVLQGDDSFDRAGCEDPRVVQFGKTYYMTYVCNSGQGPQQQCLATSPDLLRWKKEGVVLRPGQKWDEAQVKAAVIVPKKINGNYVMYFAGQKSAWHTSLGMAVSRDLIHWSEPLDHAVMTAREEHFDSLGVEPGATPLLLPSGILLIYNGWNAEHVHKTGWVLFSKADPSKVLERSEGPFIEPRYPFEINGRDAFTFTEGVAFFRGLWRFYYGAADRAIGLAEARSLLHLVLAKPPTRSQGGKLAVPRQ